MNWELKTDSLSVLLRVPPLSLSPTLSISLSLRVGGQTASHTGRREGVCEQTSEEYGLQKLALFFLLLSLIILDKKGVKLSSSY